MNRELITWYHSLSPEALQRLQHRYADAPVVSRLLVFLADCKQDHFTTQAAVKALYPDEFTTLPFPKLRNRFFKIRKELLMPQPSQGHEIHISQGLSEQEAEFYTLRKKVRSRNADTAIRGLAKLALNCKALNLFEIYPYVLHERLYGLMLMNQLTKTKEVLEELDIANQLQADWNQVLWLYRKAYEEHQQHYKFEAVAVILQKIRNITRKHTAWPRFNMAYLYACIAFETATPQSTYKAALKHLNLLEQLVVQNPDVPIYNVSAQHQVHTLYQIEQFKVSYHFNTGEFELAYQSLSKNWKRVTSGEIDRTFSESEYRNKVKLELSTGRFQQAILSVKELIQFQKTTGRLEDISLSYQELALIYIYAYPQIAPDAPAKLIQHMEQRLKQLQDQSGKDGRGYAEALVTLAALCLILKKYKQALDYISRPEAVAYYGDENYPPIRALYQLPIRLKGKSSLAAQQMITQFIDSVQAKLNTTRDSIMLFMYQFMLKVARNFDA
jgi:tetratricopeptide (TPR) repeat protein